MGRSSVHSDALPVTYIPSSISTEGVRVLQLSDLHFDDDQSAAERSANSLALDLRRSLRLSQVDVLLLSGDIADRAKPSEYETAALFLQKLTSQIDIARIISLPGNHDVDWETTRASYQPRRISELTPEQQEASYQVAPGYAEVPTFTNSPFESYSAFHERATGVAYPAVYSDQFEIHALNSDVQLVTLNSSWQTDHLFPKRVTLNMDAVQRAASQIEKMERSGLRSSYRILAIHHPVGVALAENVKNTEALEYLAQAGVRFVLHGHIHKISSASTDLRYGQYGVRSIGAGTFSPDRRRWAAGYPMGYLLHELWPNRLRVLSRGRSTPESIWGPDPRWGGGDTLDPVSSVVFNLE